jgi:predicted nucleic acid-binding protein
VKRYFDSAVIVKLYVPEPNSRDAFELVRDSGAAVPFSQLHENEVRNAIRLKRNRGELSDAEVATAFYRLDGDLSAGLLFRPTFDWSVVWTKADNLSDAHARHVSCRTLDTLHVALATVLGFREFASFDIRQRQLAVRAGLHVRPA